MSDENENAGPTCGVPTDGGGTCGVRFGLCDCHGMCFAHAPCKAEKRKKAQRAGAAATNNKKRKGDGLTTTELPPLESHEAAETWTDAIGRAAATGRLSAPAAQAALRAVREWRESHDAGAVSEQFEELMDALAEWRETGDQSAVLELVDGGES